jgi:NAD-dependent DNA ligase
MISIDDAYEFGFMSAEVLDELPRKCGCGHDLVLTDNLVQLYCPNGKCYLKIASRLEEMAKLIGADGWGEASCREVCKDFGLKSPIDIFDDDLRWELMGRADSWEKKLDNIEVALNKEWEIYEIVQLLRLDGIVTTANKLFRGYNTIEEAYYDFENGGAVLVADRLGIGKGDESVMAVNIYNTLMKSKDELLKAEKLFKVKKACDKQIKIAITGGVGGFKSKTAFVNELNNLGNGKVSFFLNNTVTQDTNFLICDAGASNSNKYKKAVSYGIPILTATNMVNTVKMML